MIRFACKVCGKSFERADDAAGTLIFCECGTGNRVPWSVASTVANPVSDDEESRPAPSLPGRRGAVPAQDAETDRPRPAPRMTRERRERDPACCFNHQQTPFEATCSACGLNFCKACVVALRGKVMCGPCKNHQLQKANRAPELSVLAVLAMVMGLLAGPFSFCLACVAAGGNAPAPAILAVGGVSLLPLVLVMVLGGVALYQIETNPRVSGRSVAMTALVSGVISTVLVIVLNVLVLRLVD